MIELSESRFADRRRFSAKIARGPRPGRRPANRTMVLIRNENCALPLSKSLKKVAVFGPLAYSKQEIESGWPVEGLISPGGENGVPGVFRTSLYETNRDLRSE